VVEAVSAAATHANPIVVVMGVASSGKSSIGRALAERCGFPFVEGDDLHPTANVERMSKGIPLDDSHRKDWLAKIAEIIADADASIGMVVTCSALKRSYRDQLAAASDRVVFLHLTGNRGLIEARMAHRRGHFMPTSLLDSQFGDLEPPQPDEHAITLDVTEGIDDLVGLARQRLNLAC
jgi:gluconokinase